MLPASYRPVRGDCAPSDEQLVLIAQRKTRPVAGRAWATPQAALECLRRRYSPLIWNRATRWCGKGERASLSRRDLMQQLWMTFVRTVRDYRADSPRLFRALLVAALDYRCRDARRCEWRAESHLDRTISMEDAQRQYEGRQRHVHFRIPEWLDDSLDPAVCAARAEDVALVRSALAKLAIVDAAIVTEFLDGQTVDAMAERRDWAPRTVYRHLQRSFVRFASLLRGLCPEKAEGMPRFESLATQRRPA